MIKKAIAAAALAAFCCTAMMARDNVKGKVTIDGKPAAGVLVTDGTNIVKTDAKGRYSFESTKQDSLVWITVPSGATPVKKDSYRPDFWAWFDKGVGKVDRHNFALVSEDQSKYSVVFLPDLHLSNDPRREDIRRFETEVYPFIQGEIAKAAKNGPVYAMNLGDLTHEIYWYEFNFKEDDAVRLLDSLGFSTTMYSIMGNHDHDGGIVGKDVDKRSAWIYRRCWGPDRYSVNIGNDHWVFLDNIYYINVAGKGKKAPGINGDRSYEMRLTDEQLDWLEKDLSYVPDAAHVYICAHAPFYNGGKKDGMYMPAKQLARIDAMVARFQDRTLDFAGHIHKFDFVDNSAYPHLMQYAFPCASGVMWETSKEAPLTCSDGAEAGIYTGFCDGSRQIQLSYDTYRHGPKYYRIYDMNTVAEAYRTSEGIAKQQKLAPTRINYAAPEFENCVFVNYWGWEPGETVEMYENGQELKVVNKRHEDPVHNIVYDVHSIVDPYVPHSVRPKDACNHMFEAKAATATSDVEIIIKASDGTVRYRETLHRPKAFSIDME